MLYIILAFSAISDRNNVIHASPSEMYHDIFQKEKKYDFLETIDIKGKTNKYMQIHANKLEVNFIYEF